MSDDDTDDVKEEDSSPPDVEPSNDNNSERNRSLEVSNNTSDLQVIDITGYKLICMSTDTILNLENQIKHIIIDEEIVDIIEQ